jgi:hypothetical protein
MQVKWRDDNTTIQAGILIFVILFGLSLLGSVFTILAINVLFATEIPITIATVFSVAWIKMMIHAFFKSAKGVFHS